MLNAYVQNTLQYDPELCIGCGMCVDVCPHGVFAWEAKVALLARRQACMECGACQRNCPAGAIRVESGVGCATAMMYAALRGRSDVSCGAERGPGRGTPCG
jgi:ferredoxin